MTKIHTPSDFVKIETPSHSTSDTHQLTASRIFRVPVDNVTPEQRRYAKTVNYASLYSTGPATFESMLRAAQRLAA